MHIFCTGDFVLFLTSFLFFARRFLLTQTLGVTRKEGRMGRMDC